MMSLLLFLVADRWASNRHQTLGTGVSAAVLVWYARGFYSKLASLLLELHFKRLSNGFTSSSHCDCCKAAKQKGH
jgi:hypothetical protein